MMKTKDLDISSMLETSMNKELTQEQEAAQQQLSQ